MALIKCPECGKEISNKAKCCIHCGYPLDEISSNEYKDILTRECLNEKEDTHNFSQKINSSFVISSFAFPILVTIKPSNKVFIFF